MQPQQQDISLAPAAARPAGALQYLWAFGATAVACLVLMIFVDAPLARALKDGLPPEATEFFSRYGGAVGKPDAYYVVAAVIILISHGAGYLSVAEATRQAFRRARNAALFVAVSIAAGGLAVNIAKPVIGRIRPRALFEDGTYGIKMFSFDWGMNSFPSGHAQMAFSLGTALALIFPRLAVPILALAAAIAATRVLGTVHYLSDIVMGAYVGIAAPLLIKRYFCDPRGIVLGFRSSP